MVRKIILFDFDGTIADTLPAAVSIINLYGSKYGIKYITQEEVKRLQGTTPMEVMGEFKVPIYKLPFFLNKIRGEILKRMDEVEIFKGMKSALSQLKRDGYGLAIMTSSPKENVLKFLELKELMMFDFVYSNKNIFGKAKTLSSIIHKEKGLSDFVYVGDEVRDITACQKIGLPIISVTWGFNSKSILAKYSPDAIVSTPEELVKAIRKLS